MRANGPANVRLVGHVPRAELGRYYRHAVALLFPSRGAETFGLSAIEALACSTPVVSTRCGGTEDIVSPEVGYLYNTSEELAGHLDRLWNDRQERDRLGNNGRRRFEALYTPEIYLDAYLAAVDRARAGHQRRANP